MRYASMRNLDISNGEGVGVSLFVQGCPFHCFNCFNPDTWDFNGGKEWTTNTKEQFMKLIDRPYIKRVSFLGGEPLAKENIDEICELIRDIKKMFPDKTIWLYTGFQFELLQSEYNEYSYTPFANDADEWLTRWEIINNVDILVDGRYIDDLKDYKLAWRGSNNQKVIDIQKTLKQERIVLYCD